MVWRALCFTPTERCGFYISFTTKVLHLTEQNKDVSALTSKTNIPYLYIERSILCEMPARFSDDLKLGFSLFFIQA